MNVKLTAILSAKVDAFVNGINQATGKLQTFGSKADEIGSRLSTNLTLPLSLIGGASLKAAADMDALKKGLTSIMGSSQAAERELTKLKEVAKLPGLGFEEAVKGSINLQAAGFTADLARRALAGFGNALATVGKGKAELEGVNLALTQMATSPKVLQEEINQIRERLPQFSQMMIQAFGTARSEDIQKLGISGKAFVERMVVELEKLPKATGGLKNAFENATDSITSNAAKLGESINKNFNVEGLLNKLADSLTEITDKFMRLSPEMQKVILTIAGMAAAVGPLAIALGSVAKILPVVVTGIRLLAGPVGILAAGVILLASNWDLVRRKVLEATAAFHEYVGNNFRNALVQDADAIRMANEHLARAAEIRRELAGMRVGPEITGDQGAAEDIREPVRTPPPPKTNLIDPDAERKLNDYIKAQSEASQSITDSLQRVRDISISLITDETERKRAELKAQAADSRVKVETEIKNEQQKAREIRLINEKLDQDLRALGSKPTALANTGLKVAEANLKVPATLPGASQMLEKFDQMALELKAKAESLGGMLGSVLGDSFAAFGEAMASGENPFAAFGKSILKSFGQMLSMIGREMLKQAAALAALAILSGGALSPVAIRTGLAGAALITAGSAMSSVKLAKGGLAFGPTLATVGDNVGASYDPEVVSPLSKLREYMGGGGQTIRVEGIISNDTIRLSNSRGSQTRQSLRGRG